MATYEKVRTLILEVIDFNHPDELRHLKATASQLAALIQYIQNLPVK